MRKFFIFLLCVCVFSTLYAQGYASVSPQAFAQQTQTLRELQYSLQSIQSRLDAIEQRQNSLAARMTSLEKGTRFADKDDLAALRSDLNALRATQGEMREAVVDEISGKMAKLINQRDAAQKKAQESKQKSGYEHVVEAGQTVSAIAQAYKVSVRSILQANNIKDPTKIRVGQKLFIPDP